MIIMRNSAVMIPVMLYRMIMATAVVGEGPRTLLLELDEPLLELPLGLDCCIEAELGTMLAE
jgi:hypothetical protein